MSCFLAPLNRRPSETGEGEMAEGPSLPPAIIDKLRRLGDRPPVLSRIVEVLRAIDTELLMLQRLLAEMRAEGVE
jgi:hypothetical protein